MAHRQAISTIRTTLHAQTRKRANTASQIHTSTSSRAAVISVPQQAFSSEDSPIEAITLAPIFDIFDVPHRLRSGSSSSSSSSSATSTRSSSPASPFFTLSSSPATASYCPSYSSDHLELLRSHPSSLPAPIVFDGPAQPKNPILASRARSRSNSMKRELARSTSPSPHQLASGVRYHSTSGTQFGLGPAAKPPLVQMFEGPARITRYHHRPSGKKSVCLPLSSTRSDPD